MLDLPNFRCLLSSLGNGPMALFAYPCNGRPVPFIQGFAVCFRLWQEFHPHFEHFILEVLKECTVTVGCFQCTPCVNGRLVSGKNGRSGANRLLYRKANDLLSVRPRYDQSVPQGLFLIRGLRIHRGALNGQCPPVQRREWAKWKAAGYRTRLNIRSHRILLSPCWAAFCLENHTKEARPTMWVSGTNPHILESADRWRLSPIIQ